MISFKQGSNHKWLVFEKVYWISSRKDGKLLIRMMGSDKESFYFVIDGWQVPSDHVFKENHSMDKINDFV